MKTYSTLLLVAALAGCGTSPDVGSTSRKVQRDACPGLEDAAFEPSDTDEEGIGRGAEGLAVLRAEAEASLDTFRAQLDENGAHYRYARTSTSFTGASCRTTIEVEGGEVVRRSQTRSIPGTQEETWTETGDSVGTTKGACHPALPLEDLYATCLDEVLCKHPDDHYLFLETSEEGLLSACVSSGKLCADDCGRGPSVDSFEWL